MKTSKQEARLRMAAVLERFTRDEIEARSATIRERLLERPEVSSARSIFSYVSFGREVETRALIRDLLAMGKTVAVPRIAGRGIMEAHRIESLEDLAPGPFGILAPRSPAPLDGSPDVSVCPGVAFTERGERLGRGQAYYDRFLALHSETFAVAICFEEQIVAELPTEPTDRRMRLIITDRRAVEIA
ncbi:MAG: 5-formyltetrahydrofolate cyclo-ligase [Planctomycetes bacterium]|nr:5-formyltetrahydrofolate cyclo-ligase [Planctomycetota bacterium]